MVQQVEKRVREEDQVKMGIFALVDNYIMVERLRKRTKQQEKIIREKDALIKKLQQDLQKRQKDYYPRRGRRTSDRPGAGGFAHYH